MVGFSVAEPGYPRLPSHILERVTDPSFFKAVSIIIFAPISNIITIVIAAKMVNQPQPLINDIKGCHHPFEETSCWQVQQWSAKWLKGVWHWEGYLNTASFSNIIDVWNNQQCWCQKYWPVQSKLENSYRGSDCPGIWTACCAAAWGRGSRWKTWKAKQKVQICSTLKW